MKISRRELLKSTSAVAGAFLIPFQTATTLLKGGRVLSLDSAVGDFESADVLIDGSLVGVDMPRITRLLNQSRDYLVGKTGLK